MSTLNTKGPVFDPGLCRCCGSMKKCRMLNVEYKNSGQKEVYCDMLMDCFGLLMSHLDGKPTERLICATCVTRLRDAFSFKHQVLLCEEAFLQMKMYDGDHADQNTLTDESNVEGGPKIEVEVIKQEVEENDHGDQRYDDDPAERPDEDSKADLLQEDWNSADELPLITRVEKTLDLRENPEANPTKGSTRLKEVRRERAIRKSQARRANIKPQDMQRVQQLIRERDPTYMTETNILTIVEFSHVCPFKCRHNHLLCYYCGQTFSDPGLLRDHTSKMHHPKKFKVTEHKNMIKIDLTRIDCRLCLTKIDDLDDFKRHIVKEHKKKYYFDYKDSVLPFKLVKDETKCAICHATFPYFHALNKHMNVHFSNYVCETCGLGFVDRGRFVMHQQRHDTGEYPCETCGKVFRAEYNRDLHVDRVHRKRGRVYCPKCDVKLMSYPQKLKHLVEVHGEQPMSFPCTMCEKVCETRRTLTIHWRKDHLKDYRYECQCCGQKFFTRFALNNHMPTHTHERNFKCKVCEKSYPRLKTLKDHMRIHTNDRRYRCHICGQAFIQNCSLKGHMKSQHPEYG